MSEQDEYEFKFDAYTPQTIPMDRLAEYMAALARMFGHTEYVHFDRLEKGSTCALTRVDAEGIQRVAERLELVSRGEAANDAVAGFNKLNELLREDNAVATLHRRPASVGAKVFTIKFAGRDIPQPVTYGPFTEAVTVDGELVRIGGRDKTAHASIIDTNGNNWSGEISRDLAQEIAPYLYKGHVLRVRGTVAWERDESGVWNKSAFRINGFTPLEDDSLLDVTKKLRSLQNSDWSKIENIDGYISLLRGESEGLH